MDRGNDYFSHYPYQKEIIGKILTITLIGDKTDYFGEYIFLLSTIGCNPSCELERFISLKETITGQAKNKTV
jgi:hypothetical protein